MLNAGGERECLYLDVRHRACLLAQNAPRIMALRATSKPDRVVARDRLRVAQSLGLGHDLGECAARLERAQHAAQLARKLALDARHLVPAVDQAVASHQAV